MSPLEGDISDDGIGGRALCFSQEISYLDHRKGVKSLKRGSVVNEIKNNNKWVVHVKLWWHYKLQEGKIYVLLIDGVNLFNKFDTRNIARIS